MANMNENICKAVDIIVNKRLNDYPTDQTIKAEVVECLNAALGEYRIKYQDSFFSAFATDNNIVYSPGMIVDITVPNGDYSNTKKINPNSSLDATVFMPLVDEYSTLYQTSRNLLENAEASVLGDQTGIYTKNLYTREKNTDVDYSFQEESFFVLESDIITKNLLKLEGKIDFGFKVILNVFKNLRTTDIINQDYDIVEYRNGITDLKRKTYYYEQKEFIFTIADMKGNPFQYDGLNHIYKVFDISNEKIYNIQSVDIYIVDNINTKNDKEQYSIELSNFKLYTAKKYNYNSLNTYALSIKSDLYSYYYAEPADEGEFTLELNLLTRGRPIDLSKAVPAPTIYWFQEDASISIGSEDYSSYGGVGWRCLNDKIETDNGFYWLNDNYTITLPKSILGIKSRFKAIIHYGADRQIIDTTYYRTENTYYRNDVGFSQFGIYCYKEHDNNTWNESDKTNLFGSTRNVSAGFNDSLFLHMETPQDDRYTFYWSKSDTEGAVRNIKVDDDSLDYIQIYASEVSEYSYYTCTVKNQNDDIILTDSIRITNQSNLITLDNVDNENQNFSDDIEELYEEVDKNTSNIANNAANIARNNTNIDSLNDDINVLSSLIGDVSELNLKQESYGDFTLSQIIADLYDRIVALESK